MSKIAVSAAHLFDEAMALTPVTATIHEHGRESARHWQGQTHPAYANMVGPFGGITAAQALQSILLHPERLGEPVSFTVNFAAALADGEFRVHVAAGAHQPLHPALGGERFPDRCRRPWMPWCSPPRR